MQNTNKLKQLVLWFLPSGTELIIYGSLTLLTLAVSNLSQLRDFVYAPAGFSLASSILDSINNLLQRFVGDEAARSGVVAFFWALVGLLAYVVIWVGINFSTELGNDLAIKKYVHPKGVDTSSPLISLLTRSVLRLLTFVILTFYINALVFSILPYSGGLFREAITQWPKFHSIKYGLMAFIGELAALHIFTILVRLVLLRKRVFNS